MNHNIRTRIEVDKAIAVAMAMKESDRKSEMKAIENHDDLKSWYYSAGANAWDMALEMLLEISKALDADEGGEEK